MPLRRAGLLEVQGPSSAIFTTSTGLTTVHATGMIDVNGGTFNANSDVLVDGGTVRARNGGGAQLRR